jgi:hypothetical protein
MYFVFAKRSGLYLADDGTWTLRRGAAKSFGTRSGAMRALRRHRREHGLELSVVGPPAVARARPGRTREQLRALELVRRYGALKRQGQYWVPAGMPGPHLEPVTISSLVTRGELAVTAEGPSLDGRRFGYLRHRRRWLEVREREVTA